MNEDPSLRSILEPILLAMRDCAWGPKRHVFVCVNTRTEDSPLGTGCGARGEDLYVALKDEVQRRNLSLAVWVTRTFCLGICPKVGATVASYPNGGIWADVTPDDVPLLLKEDP